MLLAMLKYSLEWSKGVVKSFTQNHESATTLFCKLTGMSTKHLILSLASNEGTWDSIKSLIGFLEDALNHGFEHSQTTIQTLRSRAKSMNKFASATGCGPLTDFIAQPMLDERMFR